jgi:hypothetical protein
MTILKAKVKALDIPVVFTREGNDSHNNKTYVFLRKMVHLRIWNEKPFEDMSLTLMVGHGQTYEKEDGTIAYAKVLRVFWHNNRNSTQCIEDFHLSYDVGLSIEVDESEELLDEKTAKALILSGTVMFLNSDLSKRTLYV